MSVDGSARITGFQVGDKPDKRSPLRFGARVLGRFAVGGTATDVADADGIGIVALAMRPDFPDRSALVDGAVTVDDEVIADATEAALMMPLVYLLYGEILALRGCGAMEDDFTYASHKDYGVIWLCGYCSD